jgi:hypothetical protein
MRRSRNFEQVLQQLGVDRLIVLPTKGRVALLRGRGVASYLVAGVCRPCDHTFYFETGKGTRNKEFTGAGN